MSIERTCISIPNRLRFSSSIRFIAVSYTRPFTIILLSAICAVYFYRCGPCSIALTLLDWNSRPKACMRNGWIQTLFLWILKSSNFGIPTISSDSQSKMSQESKKIRSRDRRIFEKNPYYEIKTLTHNNVNTVSDRSNWTGSSDSACDLVPLTEVWWRRDYVMWRNNEKSFF